MYNIVNSPVPDINSKRSDDFKNFMRLCLNKVNLNFKFRMYKRELN